MSSLGPIINLYSDVLDDIPHSSLEGFNIWLSYSYWEFNYLIILCGH